MAGVAGAQEACVATTCVVCGGTRRGNRGGDQDCGNLAESPGPGLTVMAVIRQAGGHWH